MNSKPCSCSTFRGLYAVLAAAASVFSNYAAICVPAAAAALPEPVEASSQSPDDGRAPVPPAEAQRQAVTKIREIFAQEYAAAKTADEKRNLARSLIDEAGRSKDPVDRWSLFAEGMRTAAAAGDVGLTLEATDAIVAGYQVNPGVARLNALLALADKAPPQAAETVSQKLLELVTSNQVTESNHRSAAVAEAMETARKSKNKQLITLATQAQAQLKREESAAKELERVNAKLRESPDDPDACLEAGVLLCFTQGDWDRGLPLLARGSDASLAALARAESRRVDEAPKIVALADNWLAWAARQKGDKKAAATSRARVLLMAAVDKLEGLDRTGVQKRLAALEDTTPGPAGRSKDSPRNVPGLVLWLEAGDAASFSKPPKGVPQPGGDRVEAWKDLSGQGNHALQPDVTKQPQRLDGAVVFNGDQFLTLQGPLPGTAVTILAVYRSSKATADSTLLSTRTASTSGWMIDHQAGSVWFRAFAEGGMGQAAVTPPAVDGLRVVLARLNESGNAAIQVAGVPPASSDKKLDLKPGGMALAVGGKTGDAGGSHFRGELLRVLVFSRALSDNEVASLLAWSGKSGGP